MTDEQLIDTHFPPMSEKRNELRKQWNKEHFSALASALPGIDWEWYLLVKSKQEEKYFPARYKIQIRSLENALKSIHLYGLELHAKNEHDKRKTVPKFFLTIHGNSISPVLDYDRMNHFLLGFMKASKLLAKGEI